MEKIKEENRSILGAIQSLIKTMEKEKLSSQAGLFNRERSERKFLNMIQLEQSEKDHGKKPYLTVKTNTAGHPRGSRTFVGR